MQKNDLFECLFCERTFPADVFDSFCPVCGEPLFCSLPVGQRRFYPNEIHPLRQSRNFLPLTNPNLALDPGTGQTPLVSLDRLRKTYGLPPLYAKLESREPTGSFKDRGTAIAVQKALSLGISKIGTVSTGNMASSTAAYGTRFGMETYLLVKEDTSEEKILPAAVFSSLVFKVAGDYGKLFEKSSEIGKKLGIYFMNSVDPFRIEGYKTAGFEIYFQLGRKAPDVVCVPVSSGGHIIGLIRAFEDLYSEGLIDHFPVFVGIQASGCSPVSRAFSLQKDKVSRTDFPGTLAHSISNPAPPAGNAVLKLLRRHKGFMLDVPDKDILHAQRELACLEGVFCLPSSAVTLAGLLAFRKKVNLEPGATCVFVITGTGLKGIRALDPGIMNIHRSSLENLGYMIERHALKK